MLSASVANAATVYFDNTGNWTKVNAYTWTGGSNNGWPGVQVTETVTEGAKTYYKYETTDDMIIFNNGAGQQTGDSKVADNMIYDASGATGNLFGGGSVVIVKETFFAGKITNWGSSDPNYKFTDEGNGIFTFELAELTNEGENAQFKIVYDNKWYSTSSPIESGVEYTLSEGGDNAKLAAAGTDLKFTFNANTKVLKVVYTSNGGGGGDDPIPPTPGEKNVYLAGEFNGYNSTDADYKFTGNDGVYTLHLDSFDSNFKVVCNGTWLGYVESAIESGVEYTLVDTGMENCKLTAPATDVTFVFTAATNTLKVTYTAGDTPIPPTPTVPAALYLVGGTIDGNEWDPAAAVEMTKEGNVFSCTAKVNGAMESADVYFSFLTAKGSWEEVNAYTRYGATTKDAPIAFGEAAAIKADNSGDAPAYKLTLESGEDGISVKFVVDFDTMTVTLTKDNNTSVVDAFTVEEAPVYFNLQGVKVAQPANGIYVKVANGKATKVVINK